MSSHRERLDAWIHDFLQPRHPELVPQLLRALSAFDSAQQSGVLTPERLQTILEGARNARRPLGENVAALLGDLAARFPEAQRAVHDMSIDQRAYVRVNALVAISSMRPTRLHDEVLRSALQDRSSRIRALAADKIMQFGLTQLLSGLQDAVARERHPKTKQVLQRERDLLRDGYHLHRNEDGKVWISCRLAGGATIGAFVTAEELQAQGPQGIARRLGAVIGAPE